ncbi:hypothetical protein RUND412_006472 [Rhizina undulata]
MAERPATTSAQTQRESALSPSLVASRRSVPYIPATTSAMVNCERRSDKRRIFLTRSEVPVGLILMRDGSEYEDEVEFEVKVEVIST